MVVAIAFAVVAPYLAIISLGMTLQAFAYQDISLQHGCTKNYTSWSQSATYKTGSNWNLQFIPKLLHYKKSIGGQFYDLDDSTPKILEQFIDINGDGGLDYVSSYRSPGNLVDCVYLNNGTGWTPVFRCVKNGVGNYYGDCAK
jgi:hypothetical protein